MSLDHLIEYKYCVSNYQLSFMITTSTLGPTLKGLPNFILSRHLKTEPFAVAAPNNR